MTREITDDVRDRYADVARGQLSNESSAVRAVAAAFGYSAEELNLLPAEANMGLSCGNPLALAGLREGEVVVDLGCGGGMDVFLAARKVGPTGRVHGIDMTEEMLNRARAGQRKLGLENVEFHLANVERLPLADHSVDCVISNCVINLVPDKSAVFREIYRVLKPGGRIALSDIALKLPLPPAVKQSVEAYVGCISGAILIDEYRSLLEQAGFENVVVTNAGADLNAYASVAEGGCCGGQTCDSAQNATPNTTTSAAVHDGLAQLLQNFDANQYAASVRVHALKPTSVTQTDRSPLAELSPVDVSGASKLIQVYDRPMCCSTGICGPEVDPVLPQFASDLEWLKSQGYRVERFNLAQQPQAFIDNQLMYQMLSTEGTNCLPAILIDGQVVSRQVYPDRQSLARWLNNESPKKQSLPIAQGGGGCCGSNGCC